MHHKRLAAVADAIVIDRFIGGDGSLEGTRTLRTRLPAAMRQADPQSTTLGYRDSIA